MFFAQLSGLIVLNVDGKTFGLVHFQKWIFLSLDISETFPTLQK